LAKRQGGIPETFPEDIRQNNLFINNGVVQITFGKFDINYPSLN
jgi:hypothetical protein